MLDNWCKDLYNLYCENKLSHAFLIETNNIDKCYYALKELIKQICDNSNLDEVDINKIIDNDELPSFITIRPNGKDIKKEQIIELKEKFKYKPLYTNFNIYTIINAEKLNASSANSLLKFIEEPDNNILGFLITNNKEAVIETIKSRCQIIKVNYENISEKEIDEKIFQIIDLIENNDIIIKYKNTFGDMLKNKDELVNLLEQIIEIYLNIIENKTIPTRIQFISKNDYKKIIKKVELTKKIIQRLRYNVNIEILMDYYALEMEKINEGSICSNF